MAYDLGKEITKNVLKKLETGDPVIIKQGEYSLSSYVRDKMRENGILRSNILPPIPITDSELDKDDNVSIMKKYVPLEPDSKATWIPFRGAPESRIVEGKHVPAYFGEITSEEHVLNINELRNYSVDLRKILDAQDVKNLQTQEDTPFIEELNRLAALNPAEQDLVFHGGLTKVTWKQARQAWFPDKPLKFALMNVRTFKEFSAWSYTEDMGFGPHGSDMFSKGELGTVHGINIIQTIKVDLVKDGEVFFFAPEDFIGKFFELQKPTTLIEQKGKWIKFSTSEIISTVIANIRSFTKNRFIPG